MASNAEGFDPSGSHDIDFLVYGRRSRTRRLLLGEEKAQLTRMVSRVPEVMVKVSGGGKTAPHVKAHMNYITRNGQLEATNDQDEKISGKEEVREVHDSWDLDASNGQGKYRQAFNIVLSMPAGTDPDGLYKAVRNFAREQFYGQHHYLMALHTPETDPHKKPSPHPHVHLIIKAENTIGQRLHIRKATLEQWRSLFAEKLREQGIAANATPRDVRGQTRKGKVTGVYFAEQRGNSSVLKSKFEEVGRELSLGKCTPKPWEVAIINRRKAVMRSLNSAAQELRLQGDEILAIRIERYTKDLPRLETERHQMMRAIVTEVRRARYAKKDRLAPAGTATEEKER